MKKIIIVYGDELSALQRKAVETISIFCQECTHEYPVCFKYDENFDTTDARLIYLGTKKNNPKVADLSDATLTKSEEYYINVKGDVILIEGFDDAGVLYGAIDFYHKYIVRYVHHDARPGYFDMFAWDDWLDFKEQSAPAIAGRGLWTWGHVIYDYKKYFDNMMLLKMNRVVIWNDFAPFNANEIVEYAHSCNIKVIWGFSWLWDTACNRVDPSKLEGKDKEILEKYEREYAGLKGDGIYFQTFTELTEDNINGVVVANAATDFVNKTAKLFYQKYPDLQIEFGLHATSVKDRLPSIAQVDPRMKIVWEDCGAFPFDYLASRIGAFDETKELVGKIANLRGKDDYFGVVTKGITNLDWGQFRHLTGRQNIGVSSQIMKKDLTAERRGIWKYVQACWIANSDKALEMVQEMRRLKGGNLSVDALVEDGVFEETVMYPVALYAEMLWDTETPLKEMEKRVALRSYVTFA
ncbi:MAG: hypothetical protein E7352_01295 [Clostridiales bacterium]|nr:hypothetical protein [Clostridiales bacterium]